MRLRVRVRVYVATRGRGCQTNLLSHVNVVTEQKPRQIAYRWEIVQTAHASLP